MDNETIRIELRQIIERLDWTQKKAAEKVGVGFSTLKKWLAGDVEVPHDIIILFRIIDKFPESRSLLKS